MDLNINYNQYIIELPHDSIIIIQPSNIDSLSDAQEIDTEHLPLPHHERY